MEKKDNTFNYLNAKMTDIIIHNANVLIFHNFLIGVDEVEVEIKDNAFIYLNAKIIEIIYTLLFKSHGIF